MEVHKNRMKEINNFWSIASDLDGVRLKRCQLKQSVIKYFFSKTFLTFFYPCMKEKVLFCGQIFKIEILGITGSKII